VKDYGAVGDGVTDDAAHIQAALNAAASMGGGAVTLGRLVCYVGSNLTVPASVTFRGDIAHPGYAAGDHYYSLPSQLILAGGVAVLLNNSSTVERMVISRAGLSIPGTNDAGAATIVSQFQGTAIGATGYVADACAREVLLLGHAQGISIGGSRTLCENVLGDCLNGIDIYQCFDISRLMNCHFIGILTSQIPGVTQAHLLRSGLAFNLSGTAAGQGADWSHVIGCFAYGYSTTFNVNNTTNISFVACMSDTATGQGWNIVGESAYISLSGCCAIGNPAGYSPQGIHADLTSNLPAWTPDIRTVNCRWVVQNAINVNGAANVFSCNDLFQGCTVGVAAATGTGGSIINPSLYNVTTPFSLGTPANWRIVGAAGYGTTPAVTTILPNGINGTPIGSAAASGGTFSSLSLGATAASSASDLSHHITMHTAGYGMSVTANRLNLVTPLSGNAVYFNLGGADIAKVDGNGLSVVGPATFPQFTLNGAASTYRGMSWQTAGVNRFNMYLDSADGLNMTTCDNAGAINHNVMSVQYANGSMTLSNVLSTFGLLSNYANDAAAAAGGVVVNQFYRNGSVVMQRVA
jgi:hypothetical protein